MRHLFGFLEMAFHKQETRPYRIVGSIVWVLILGSIGFLLIDLFLPQGHRLKPT